MCNMLLVAGIAVSCLAVGLVFGEWLSTVRANKKAYKDTSSTTPVTTTSGWVSQTTCIPTHSGSDTTWIKTVKGGLEIMSPGKN